MVRVHNVSRNEGVVSAGDEKDRWSGFTMLAGMIETDSQWVIVSAKYLYQYDNENV